MQIGLRMGAEQAANIYKQQMMMRDQQKDEFERQLKAQQQSLEVDQITRKHRAISDYQTMVQGGVDPMEALQRVGPDIGISPVAAGELTAMKEQRAAQMAETASQHQYQQARQRTMEERLRANQESQARLREAQIKKMETSGRITPEIQDVGGQQIIVNPNTGHFQQIKRNVSKSQFIAQNVSKWMSEQGISDPKEAAQKLSNFYDTFIEPPNDQPTSHQESNPDTGDGGSSGDNTMPDAMSQSVTPRPVLKWNPETESIYDPMETQADDQEE
jgi:hypothetical protein